MIKNGYNYLLNLSIYNFTLEKVEEFNIEIESKNKELNEISLLSIKDKWIKDLDDFELKYDRYYEI